MTCCEHHNTALCDQGRKCPSRIPGVHTQDGGLVYRDGVVWPMEAQDQPIATPEQVQGTFAVFLWVLACAAAVGAVFGIASIAAALFQVTGG